MEANQMENYFKGCIKLEQVRPRYKELALQFHPDRRPNGDTRIMQLINDQYHDLLKSFQGTTLYNAKTKEEYSYKYNYTHEEQLRAKIDAVIALKLDNIVLEVIGSWLWVRNTSKDQKDLFNRNGVGFKFSASHAAWYWHKAVNWGKRRPTGLNLDQIRNIYGSEEVNHDRNKQLT